MAPLLDWAPPTRLLQVDQGMVDGLIVALFGAVVHIGAASTLCGWRFSWPETRVLVQLVLIENLQETHQFSQ